MAHTIANKKKLILRVKKIKGQLNSIEKALEEEKDCFKVLQQISASRGAIQSLMSEVLDGHIKEHLGNHVSEEQREQEIENLASLLKTYLK
jgi:DNA-binding FrmR family transcriptional regulator